MSLKRQILRFFRGPERGVLGRIGAPYWNGLRIATVGGLVAFSGAAIVALGAENIGRVAVIIGILGGLAGLVYHFVLMFLWFTKGGR